MIHQTLTCMRWVVNQGPLCQVVSDEFLVPQPQQKVLRKIIQEMINILTRLPFHGQVYLDHHQNSYRYIVYALRMLSSKVVYLLPMSYCTVLM